MADTGKPAWPRTPDGTTNWEAVFENPQTGFIQLIAQSPSAETLRLTTTVVIDKLFTRRGDETEVARLKQELETILAAPGDIIAKQAGVSGLLRQIKNVRIEKARVYIERKRAGAAIDRRAGWLWKIDFLLRPIVLIPVGLAFILLLSGAVYAVLQSTIGTSRPTPVAEAPAVSEPAPTEPASPQDQQTAPTASPDAPSDASMPKPPLDGTPQPLAEPQAEPKAKPIHIWLKTMRWPLSSLSTKDRPQYYAAILSVKDWDTKVSVCSRVANVMDTLYQLLNHTLPQDRAATDEELVELERVAPNVLNQIFKIGFIQQVDIVRYGEPGFEVAIRPPYCKSPNKNDKAILNRPK